MNEETFTNELIKYGPGYVLAIIMFIVWIYEKKTALGEKQNMIDALQAVINKRDSQRDEVVQALTEIKVYLRKAEGFEGFARELIDTLNRPSPKRRILDRKLAESIAKVENDVLDHRDRDE